MRGVIRNFDGYKGYGFIISKEIPVEIFAHIKDFTTISFTHPISKEEIGCGQKVEFDCEEVKGRYDLITNAVSTRNGRKWQSAYRWLPISMITNYIRIFSCLDKTRFNQI